MKSDVIIRDHATPFLRRLHRQIAAGYRRPLMAAVGTAMLKTLKAHFAKREGDNTTKRAQRGWPKQHFWQRQVAARTRLAEVTDDRARVAIDSRPFRQKVYGGTIRPGPGKRALAIPMRGEVYGRRAASNPVPDLFVLRSRQKAFLVAREDGRLTVYYRLVSQVYQSPDPQAMPPKKEVQDAINRALYAFIAKR